MAIYRFWIISLADQSILYSRFFPHLEKRDGFLFPWITPTELVRCVFVALGIDNVTATGTLHDPMSDTRSFRYSRQEMLLGSSATSLSGSTSSLTSIGSMASATTTTGSLRPSPSSMSGSFVTESSLLKEYICLYNHLPLIVCPLVNLGKPPDEDSRASPNTKPGIDHLILLIYEQNGLLFLCCPRLTSQKRRDPVTTFNECFENDQLLVEAHSISLSYTILQMMASMFFSSHGGKQSLRSIECFISTHLPFGKLIRTKPDHLVWPTTASSQPKDTTTVCLRITESVSTSFQTSSTTAQHGQRETIFGTITLDLILPLDRRKGPSPVTDIILNIDNLAAISLMLPSNCVVKDHQGSSLVYDVSHGSQYSLNVAHYKLDNHHHRQPDTASLEDAGSGGGKLFTSKYVIQKKSDHLHHLSLRLRLNDRICTEDVKFHHFMIRFSLNRNQQHYGSRKKSSSVQTLNSTSLNNLIVRDSIKISQGQIKLENSMVIWVIGTRMPKSRKLSIEFDLLVSPENIAHLETMANFNHTFQFKCLMMVPRVAKPPPKPSTKNEPVVKECRMNPYPPNMIVSCLKLSKVSLVAEPVSIVSDRKPSDMMSKEFFQIDFQLNSFEYRLFPAIE